VHLQLVGVGQALAAQRTEVLSVNLEVKFKTYLKRECLL